MGVVPLRFDRVRALAMVGLESRRTAGPELTTLP
jgi:hypothetical protein